MSGLIEITRKRLMDAIKGVQPPGKWKIVVVDSKSIEILNASCKMYDILEENVTCMYSLLDQKTVTRVMQYESGTSTNSFIIGKYP
ncbi:hypothetical protein BCR42DRAFT_74663 [Absidia repens]|uniref:Uncharacterized protein n=1 Tax=Absidia repens TaxID=90262 RepID=A0A1X2IBI0_9FUNG|nr:hypothetical protein BCR42DRAFT_74663 [Absidia repens]